MRKNKLLLLISSAGALALLVYAAVEENFLREWRRIQAQARTAEGPLRVQLRQIVNRGLRTSDRCVSCHVAMAPGEQGVTGPAVLGPHKPVVHDPAEFGCTICHSGQGQATEKADAHGRVEFWPQPMLERETSYAGCGTCHVTLGVPEKNRMMAAVAAFERLDCMACHRVDGRGGTIRPDGGGMEGPDLSRTGIAGYDPRWHEKHLARHAQAASGPWRTSFAPVSEQDLELLKVYLDTRVAAPGWVEAKSVFLASGCLGCHKVSGVGGDEGPDLTLAGLKDPGRLDFSAVPGKPVLENWNKEHFRSPASIVAGSQMPPAVTHDDRELAQLALFTLSLRRRSLDDAYVPRDRMLVARFGRREFATDGATLYGAFCAGCHGEDGMGRRLPGLVSFPSIANPDFLAIADDEFLKENVRQGRPGRRMPAWLKPDGLSADEIETVVGYVRALGGVRSAADSRPPRWVSGDAQAGERIFAATCGGCHGAKGEGGQGPALNNRVLLAAASDSYLVETIRRGRRGTAMAGFATPDSARPALDNSEIEAVVAFLRTWEGGKR
jgi:cbb3-type cytochrome c oxidase subunit III